MDHKTKHEIIYKDELGMSARIPAGTVLTEEHRKALGKDFDALVKSKAVEAVKERVVKDAGDGKVVQRAGQASAGMSIGKGDDGFNKG